MSSESPLLGVHKYKASNPWSCAWKLAILTPFKFLKLHSPFLKRALPNDSLSFALRILRLNDVSWHYFFIHLEILVKRRALPTKEYIQVCVQACDDNAIRCLPLTWDHQSHLGIRGKTQRDFHCINIYLTWTHSVYTSCLFNATYVCDKMLVFCSCCSVLFASWACCSISFLRASGERWPNSLFYFLHSTLKTLNYEPLHADVQGCP